MPDKKSELQIPLQEILDTKKGKHGIIFQIKIAHYKPMWVSEMKLSNDVRMSYANGCPLPKHAFVKLARRYAKPPVKEKTRSIRFFFGKRGPPTNNDVESAMNNKKSRTEGDGTTTKKKKKKVRTLRPMLVEAWCGQARAYIRKFNDIVDLKNKSELLKVINETKKELKPNKECDHLFQSEKFQTGVIIKHNKEHIHCLSSTKNPGEISCAVCEETFKASRVSRVINHCFHKTHIQKLKKKQVDNSQQRQNLHQYTNEGHNETTIVRRVQSFVAQQIALKGLPFTAGMCITIIRKKRIIN